MNGVRKSAHSILGRLGCIVETARDGKEAVTLAKLSRYDTMLADIRLPDLTRLRSLSRPSPRPTQPPTSSS